MGDKKYMLCLIVHAIFALLHFVATDAVSRPAGRTAGRPAGRPVERTPSDRQGRWKLLLNNTGVVAVHMALTHENTVIMFDQTSAGPSQYRLHQRDNGRICSSRSRNDLRDGTCYAHSIEYAVRGNYLRPLRLVSDPWCSSGSFLSNGTLMQIGGNGRGSNKIRYFSPCGNGRCNWVQSRRTLSNDRQYASNLLLPGHDRVIVVGGQDAHSYEFVPRLNANDKSFNLPFLHTTFDDDNGGSNLYPFLHLSSDGNLFIFANRDSILLNYRRNRVIKTFPRIPGSGSRNYPSSGSSVILPLEHRDMFQKVEVMVCGGAALGALDAATIGTFLTAMRTCGRMVITGNNHIWRMENMPGPRTMHDMLILPTGHILIINGAQRGCAGWENAGSPSLEPYLYNPKKNRNQRFTVLKATKIPRMYHSSALILPNGKVLVAGSNPNDRYAFSKVAHPTELRLQAFVPDYMDRQFNDLRPRNVTIVYEGPSKGIAYGTAFTVHFLLERRPGKNVEYSVYAPPFTTHSFSMNQRLLKLRSRNTTRDIGGLMTAALESPPTPNVAPPGYYLLTVVNAGIPSSSKWIRFINA